MNVDAPERDRPRRSHGDPLRPFILVDGLEEDRESLRLAVGGQLCHPFTTARFQGLGWIVRPSGSKVGDFLSGLPQRYELTPEGEKALAKGRERYHRIRPREWWER